MADTQVNPSCLQLCPAPPCLLARESPLKPSSPCPDKQHDTSRCYASLGTKIQHDPPLPGLQSLLTCLRSRISPRLAFLPTGRFATATQRTCLTTSTQTTATPAGSHHQEQTPRSSRSTWPSSTVPMLGPAPPTAEEALILARSGLHTFS